MQAYIVREQFAAPRPGGGMMSFSPGNFYQVPPAILKGREHKFFAVDVPDDEWVEKAEAKPGVKRSTKKPAAKAKK